jgi:hypothetical protein
MDLDVLLGYSITFLHVDDVRTAQEIPMDLHSLLEI